MLMGIFGGKSLNDLQRDAERLKAHQAKHATNLGQALADRQAAVASIQQEIVAITKLQAR